MSKLAGDSGSRRSTFMVRQFTVAIIVVGKRRGEFEGMRILLHGWKL